MKRLPILVCLCAGAWASVRGAPVAFTREDARLAHETAEAFVRACTPRDAGTLRARLAANWLLDRASRTGADVSLDVFRAPTPRGEKAFANVWVDIPGTKTNAPWIVLMSHFDTAPHIGPGFEGANDGASTCGLLVALAGAIRRAGPPRDNIALVWTDGEEAMQGYGPNDGFQGSRHLVEVFREKHRPVKSAICLDMLGDRDLHITVPANGTPVLRKLAQEAARKAGLEKFLTVRDDMNINDDHTAFFDAGCPAIDLIDFQFGRASGLNDYWHTPQDTLDKISAESLYVSGRIVAELLNLLM